MEGEGFATVWDALEETPAEAARMRIRSGLLIAIDQHVRAWGLSKGEAAIRLGVAQQQLDQLLEGKITHFSLDSLISLATKAGLDVRIEITEAA